VSPRDQAKAVKLLHSSEKMLQLLLRLVVDGNEAALVESHLRDVQDFLTHTKGS